MLTGPNPALAAFTAQMGGELVFAQVVIRRGQDGYELRQAADRSRDPAALREVPLHDLRPIAQFTAAGAFRPLKSSPNLQAGWRAHLKGDSELEFALNQLYPGALADWHAAQSPNPPATGYREFTNRQTGMYRITQKLTDAQAAEVIRAGCHERVCLKRRLWTVAGLETDPASEKSVIPCLEPCALLLELARKAMRIEQDQKIELSRGDVETALEALRRAWIQPEPNVREGEVSAPLNPRRIQLTIEKLERKLTDSPAPEAA